MEALRAAVSLFFEQARALDEQLGVEASSEMAREDAGLLAGKLEALKR